MKFILLLTLDFFHDYKPFSSLLFFHLIFFVNIILACKKIMFANNSETSNSSRCLENAVLSKSSALGLLGNNIIMGISPPPHCSKMGIYPRPPTVAKIRQTGEVVNPFSSPRDASNRIRKRKAKNWHRFLLSGMLNV